MLSNLAATLAVIAFGTLTGMSGLAELHTQEVQGMGVLLFMFACLVGAAFPDGAWRRALMLGFSVPFAHWVVSATRPEVLVELGTHNGVSYAAMCEQVRREGLATRCFAVDTWAGDEHAGFYGEDVFAVLSRFHAERFGTGPLDDDELEAISGLLHEMRAEADAFREPAAD